MRLYWSGSAIVLALVLAAACGQKDKANSAAPPAAEEGAPAAQAAATPVAGIEPCKLLTADDVKGEVGDKAVAGPTPNATNATVCEFQIGEGEVLNVAAKLTGPQETIDAAMAEMTKLKIPVSAKTGPAESFFASPGNGMVQLNTFQNGKYVILTSWMSGVPEAKQKEMLQRLMSKALGRL